MDGRLFGRTESEKKRLDDIKIQALVSCEQEHIRLKRCFRESWFGWCTQEQSAFWKCFTKEREHLLQREKSASEVPDSHWSDKEQ